MTVNFSTVKQSLADALTDLQQAAQLESGQLLVVGTSTSEVMGEHIGTSGTREAAEAIWEALSEFQEKTGVALAFQCCEHLNRALVVKREYSDFNRLELVSAVPVPGAGGSMAALAYEKLENAVLAEEIKADAGIDIGDTLIGMHLKKVAVPVRSKVRQVGEAHLTMARTRPKLIGGERAVYRVTPDDQTCH
ncbi:TIGR01440 family protein [Evansella clarkii]|uniref:TIGR01440 family protein n=1 Tax=Evansella clarkii TaxID=79879 RepID=UPI0009980854|nr:TIGR01440 family protein [Evansella clarkii]